MNGKKEDMQILNNLLKLFKPFKLKIILVIICITMSAGLSILTPTVNQRLMDEGLIAKNLKIIITYSICNLILIMIIQGLGIIETKYRSYIENLLSYNLEEQAFTHTLKMKMSFFLSTNYAEIMNNLKIDIGNISQIVDQSTFYIVTSIFRIIVGIIGLITIDWRLSILVLIATPLRYLIVKYLAKKRRNLFERFINSYEDFSGWYGDTIGGIKEIKIWGLELSKTGQFIKKQKEIIKQNIRMSYLAKANEISETVFTQAITSLIYVIGGYLIIGNSLTVGRLFAFIAYSSYVTGPIFAIMNIGYSFAGIMPSAKRYFEFINTETEDICRNYISKKLNSSEVLGNIEFKNVEFSYNDKECVLKNISFKINAGEKVAIIGSNGSGKTTVINLILRFLTPDSGSILLDGNDINSFKLKDYRKLISVVSQDVYLFNSSIRENIMLNSKKTDIEMNSAVKKSGAYRFIEEMPDKYESIVGQRGGTLSGGERQKIAMARAFIRDSKILVLDEATANYDMEAEYQVNNIIKESYKDKTIIIISHKPDILAKVDKIIVINNGVIEDIGNHIDLYNRSEFYRLMVNIPLDEII
ncbi:putative ABC transporter ATP-binding protein [Clostridium beijerinckii]|uniref:ABC transporter ATP-binding protein n=1 Tax=Clostridium beijerinckii TaxID=1520 RepID=A0AB74VGR7_CLOBE|nr:ABC transporter ATP-binding protein [Clostridium beijerinckii]NRZ24762.1 ATP-binding cassette subfamily B protein [Clostridium beijerinckii]NYB99024.1 ATP-binding cassette subfamily B protein [Clostridium beijerinckii]OOM19805.1 putative ABC transporter ATP-binding protein [Clostridium beijerinckii]QUN35569.1 ABC transporter ATP-binding protein [Clostridium beijerinckii]SQB22072.1 ABC transporter ATP-binding protein [Clostridium beijerinckii]